MLTRSRGDLSVHESWRSVGLGLFLQLAEGVRLFSQTSGSSWFHSLFDQGGGTEGKRMVLLMVLTQSQASVVHGDTGPPVV